MQSGKGSSTWVDGMECCERKPEKDEGRGEVPGRGSMGCSACSLTDLWISLLSARGWLRRLTRAASGCWMEKGERRVGQNGGDVREGFAEGAV